jgi:hypothetical protein
MTGNGNAEAGSNQPAVEQLKDHKKKEIVTS